MGKYYSIAKLFEGDTLTNIALLRIELLPNYRRTSSVWVKDVVLTYSPVYKSGEAWIIKGTTLIAPLKSAIKRLNRGSIYNIYEAKKMLLIGIFGIGAER